MQDTYCGSHNPLIITSYNVLIRNPQQLELVLAVKQEVIDVQNACHKLYRVLFLPLHPDS